MAPLLEELKGQGAQALVVDLRGNPGGFQDETLSTYDFFSPAADIPLIEIRERLEGEIVSEVSRAEKRGEYADWKIAVLIDANSASASEILARLLQLNGALLFGERTYGKGSVQIDVPLANNGKFKFTSAMYYFSATGETIDGVGIMPDVETDRPLELALEYLREELAKQ